MPAILAIRETAAEEQTRVERIAIGAIVIIAVVMVIVAGLIHCRNNKKRHAAK